ncbi:MAG: hypothetical protein ACXVJ7_08860 [Acidimicrobiia bacterium]
MNNLRVEQQVTVQRIEVDADRRAALGYLARSLGWERRLATLRAEAKPNVTELVAPGGAAAPAAGTAIAAA